jgi:hypothetical protein
MFSLSEDKLHHKHMDTEGLGAHGRLQQVDDIFFLTHSFRSAINSLASQVQISRLPVHSALLSV